MTLASPRCSGRLWFASEEGSPMVMGSMPTPSRVMATTKWATRQTPSSAPC